MNKSAFLTFSLNLLLSVFLLLSCKSDTNKADETSTDDTTEIIRKPNIADVERGIRANIEAKTKEGNGFQYS